MKNKDEIVKLLNRSFYEVSEALKHVIADRPLSTFTAIGNAVCDLERAERLCEIPGEKPVANEAKASDASVVILDRDATGRTVVSAEPVKPSDG